MRILRFLVLIAALLAVYAAQYLFDQRTLEFLRSSFISANLPVLWNLADWSSEARQTLGLYLAGIGALLFGLVAYRWSAHPASAQLATPIRGAKPTDDRTLSTRRTTIVGSILALAGVLGGAFLLVHFQQNQTESGWTHYLWVAAIAIYVVSNGLQDRSRFAPLSRVIPERSWPILLLMLAAVAILLGWQLTSVPVRVDGDQANHGLQALQIAAGLEDRIFAPSWFSTPLFAYYPAALGMALSGDWLLGSRLAGFFAGLFTIVGVWLLGCELFRRTPMAEDSLDDGRMPALLAAAFTSVGYTFIHFSRMPLYMEPVAWGVLALWALHRGVRTRSLATLGLAGLLLGLTSTLYISGYIFWAITLIWWLWFAISRRDWVRHIGWSGFALWAGGAFVFLAPFIGSWLRIPGSLYTRFQEISIFEPGALNRLQEIYAAQGVNVQGTGSVLLENARQTFLTFWMIGDNSTHFGWQGPMLDSLIGPLLLLGIGYLLLNLDQLQSWLLFSWLVAAVVLGGVLTNNPPSWPWLLPVLPVVGLLCALAVDRARSTLVQTSAPWLGQFTLFVVIGLLVLAVSTNWVTWYETETIRGNPASYAGRAIRSLPDERTPVLINTGDSSRAQWRDSTVQFLAGGPYMKQIVSINSASWPLNLPAQSSVILQPDDQALAADLQSRYAGGVFLLQRNRQGDPVLIIYQLP